MQKNICLVVLLAFIHVGIALDCYACNDCSKDKKQWATIRACGEHILAQNETGVCVKQVIGNATVQTVSRMCGMATIIRGKPHYECKGDTKRILACISCTKDFCNSATSVNLHLGIVFGVVMTSFIGSFI